MIFECLKLGMQRCSCSVQRAHRSDAVNATDDSVACEAAAALQLRQY